MGGMDGQWLGANAPDRVEKLVLANTNFYYADKTPWADRIKTVRENGLKHIVGMNMERWFTKGFIERAPQTIARMTEMFVASNLDGYIACVEAVRDMDFRESNPRITTPTLVIVGKHDPATPPVAGEDHRQNRQRRKGGRARCRAHLQCRAAQGLHRRDARLPAQLETVAMDEKERHERGMAQRRKVLGNEWVDRANAKKTPFNEEFQELITRYAWGEVWTRPHYDERTRRVLVIGTMIALAQWDEFRLHVRAALAEGGFSRGRHQGSHPAAGDLLRRAGRQPRLQGSRRGDGGIGEEQSSPSLRTSYGKIQNRMSLRARALSGTARTRPPRAAWRRARSSRSGLASSAGRP